MQQTWCLETFYVAYESTLLKPLKISGLKVYRWYTKVTKVVILHWYVSRDNNMDVNIQCQKWIMKTISIDRTERKDWKSREKTDFIPIAIHDLLRSFISCLIFLTPISEMYDSQFA